MSNITSSRLLQRALALLALGGALGLAIITVPAVRAEGAATAAKKALPLSHTFEKVKDAENGPYVLTLKNDSSEAVKVKAQVLLSVAFHATSQARNIPEQTIAAGATCTIADLSSADKVNLTAEGYAPLQIVVPSTGK